MSENKQSASESVAFSGDIVEKICSHLNVRDLRRAAGVCWFWHEMAKKQLSLRNTVESLLLPLWITPYNHGWCFEETDEFMKCYFGRQRAKKDEEPDLADANWHVSDVVRSVPKIFLVFCDANTETEYPFCDEYIECMPRSALYVEAAFLRLTVDGTELYGDTNVGTGISIPWTSNLQCEMLDINEYFKDYCGGCYDDEYASYLINKVLSQSEMSTAATNEYSCFILFLNRTLMYDRRLDEEFETYVTQLLNILSERFKTGSYSFLGTGCLWVTNSLHENTWLSSDYLYFMRIHGSALKSWSIVIDLKLSLKEVESKLLDMKEKIQVDYSTFALSSYPVNKKKIDEISDFNPTEIFKRVFPTVTLTCFYDDERYVQFGCNTLDLDDDSVFKHKKSLIYLLLTTE